MWRLMLPFGIMASLNLSSLWQLSFVAFFLFSGSINSHNYNKCISRLHTFFSSFQLVPKSVQYILKVFQFANQGLTSITKDAGLIHYSNIPFQSVVYNVNRLLIFYSLIKGPSTLHFYWMAMNMFGYQTARLVHFTGNYNRFNGEKQYIK